VSGIRKSTDFGLSSAERKTLRASEAQEAMSDHNDAQKAFNENRERLRQARLERETAAGPMLHAAPGLPDDTLVEKINLSTRIRNALTAGGLKTAGEIREASDATLLSLQDLGPGSLRHLRERLGL
jgi:DNA-directed RNA polymerase alpha subunit